MIMGLICGFIVLFGGAGALGYMTFGSDIQTVVLVNLDESNPTVQTVRFASTHHL